MNSTGIFTWTRKASRLPCLTGQSLTCVVECRKELNQALSVKEADLLEVLHIAIELPNVSFKDACISKAVGK